MAILTVYTELLDNTLSGARIIDMDTQLSCACFVLPKDKVAEVGEKHKWVKQHAFYILLGVPPTTGKRMGYIDETNDLLITCLTINSRRLQDVEVPFTTPSSAGSFCTGAACQGTEACVDKVGKKYPIEWWQDKKMRAYH